MHDVAGPPAGGQTGPQWRRVAAGHQGRQPWRRRAVRVPDQHQPSPQSHHLSRCRR